MRVDIWSDVACPFCYLGKVRFEQALAGFDHRDDVEVRYRSFLLDPGAAVDQDGDIHAVLAQKRGITRDQARAMSQQLVAQAAELGMSWDMDRQIPTAMLDAHRLLHLARVAGRQETMIERLYRAHFVEGLHVGRRDVLVDLAAEVGLDPAAVRTALDGDDHLADVQADIDQANRYGIRGVPFFVYADTYAVSGAQPAQVHRDALDQAWREQHPLVHVTAPADGDGCTDDVCAPGGGA